MKTFAELKRALTLGKKITLLWADRTNHKYLGTTREIVKVQTNAIKLEGGSWLGLGSTGETAKNFLFDGDTFEVLENITGEYKPCLKYKIEGLRQ